MVDRKRELNDGKSHRLKRFLDTFNSKRMKQQCDNIRKKHRILFGVIVGLVLSVCICSLLRFLPIPYTLHLGIFSTSNWNVPESGTYTIVDEVISRFESAHPYVKVKYTSGIVRDDYSQWLSEQIVKGMQPDLFMVLDQDFNTMASLGALKELNSFIEQNQYVQSADFYSSAIEEGTYNHQIYALPYQCNLKLMFVNKGLLKKEGIVVPDWNWTTEDLLRISSQITKDSDFDGIVDQWGISGYTVDDTIEAFGLNLFNDEGNTAYINQNDVRQAVLFMQEMAAVDQSNFSGNTTEGFDSGQTAFAPMSLAEYKTYGPYPWKVRRYSTFDWTILPMPSLNSEQSRCSLETLMMGISATTAHPQDAWDLLRLFTCDPEIQTMMMEQTSGTSAMVQLVKNTEIANDEVSWDMLDFALSHTKAKKRFRKFEDASRLLNNGISKIIRSSSDLDLELLDLQKQLNSFLRE